VKDGGVVAVTVNRYHDGLFQDNLLEYVHFNSRVIDDVSFDVTAFKLLKNDEDLGQFVKACYENNFKIDLFTKHNGYDIIKMINEDLHPKKHVGHVDSDTYGETNVPFDDVANVVEHFKHKNKGNVNIPRMTTDDPWLNKLNDHNKLLAFCNMGVSKGKYVGLKGKKPKTVDDDECETSKQGSKNGDGSTCVLENEVNDEDGKLYFGGFYVCFHGVKQGWLEGCRKIIGLDVEWDTLCSCNGWVYAHEDEFNYEVAKCQPPPLPHVERKMPGRPKKRRIRHPTEDDDHVLPEMGRVMHCNKCWEIEHNKTRCPDKERPKPAYLRSKGIVFHEAPSTSNTMTPSSSNTMPPPPTPSPSTSNTIPPPSGFNTMPPPPTPSSSNTMPSHATPGLKTSACPKTMPSASIGTNKGKCPLIPKKRGRPAKSSASSSIGGFRGGVTSRGGSRDGATSRDVWRRTCTSNGTSESPQMVSSVKLPILKKEKYTLWSMMKEQYLTNTDYGLWQNNIALIMRNKEGIDEFDTDDIYNNLKVFEADIKGSSGPSSNSQNAAFLFAEDTNCINEVNTANGSNSPHLDDEDLEQIDHDDLEEIDLKWECRALRNQGNRNEDARVRYDWSYIAQEEPTEFALMAYTSGTDTELGLESVEAQLIVHQKNETAYEEKIVVLEFEVKDKGNAIIRLTNQLDQTLKEKEDLKAKLEQFEISSKNLNKLIKSQPSAKDKTGLGYGDPLSKSDSEVLHSVFDSRSSDGDDNPTNDRFKKDDGYHVVPPSLAENYMPPLADLSFAKLDDYVYRPTTNKASASISKDEPSVIKTSNISVEMPKVDSVKTIGVIIKDCVSNDEDTLGNPQQALKYKGMFDIRCSRHMTGNKALLTDYQDIDGGFVAFGGSTKGGKITCIENSVLFTESKCHVLFPDFKLVDESQVLLRVPRQNNMYSFDLKNVVSSEDLTYLFAKATIYESNLWHMRLGYVNFKTINKLVNGNLVRGLPSKTFENDHTCVACHKRKQHKASCKAKLVSSISQPLQLLHMDLFGPIFVRNINHKTYCLVVTDDFSRFNWVFYLATKSETSEILKKFIAEIENQLNKKVKVIRSDNGTKFKNREMDEFCGQKGIKREYSVSRTPQQNGVAERKNMTMIEAARTMLANSLLPTIF
nr:putative ribonuclease H-like domain-containing protein [Tanacetum cinerariifolium]